LHHRANNSDHSEYDLSCKLKKLTTTQAGQKHSTFDARGKESTVHKLQHCEATVHHDWCASGQQGAVFVQQNTQQTAVTLKG
jgi:hypothetical protein